MRPTPFELADRRHPLRNAILAGSFLVGVSVLLNLVTGSTPRQTCDRAYPDDPPRAARCLLEVIESR